MNVALITYDENLKKELVEKLPNITIKTYIDSISMLKDIDNFNPSIIIYDASTGDFAQEDLKFLISRNKVKDKKFKVLYSDLNPINKDEFKEDIPFFNKDREIQNLINDISKEIGGQVTSTQTYETQSSVKEMMDIPSLETPEDIESFYATQSEDEERNIPSFEEMLDSQMIQDRNPDVDEEPAIPEIPEEILKAQQETEEVSQKKETLEEPERKVSSIESHSSIINITISKEEIEKSIVNLALEKLIEDLKNDPEIEEIKNTISRDFIERITEEVKELKEEIKKEFKENISKRLEEEINLILKQELKDYIAQITTKIVEDRLNQIFRK